MRGDSGFMFIIINISSLRFLLSLYIKDFGYNRFYSHGDAWDKCLGFKGREALVGLCRRIWGNFWVGGLGVDSRLGGHCGFWEVG